MNRDTQTTPLPLCQDGSTVLIDVADLDATDRSMLEAMGVEHGCEVEICHVGSPCILKVDARRFGVGREVASRIRVTLAAPAGA